MGTKPVCINDFKAIAKSRIKSAAWDYLESGADEQETHKDNPKSFARHRLRPKCLVDVTNPDISTTVLGTKIGTPIGISPSAYCCLAHPDGECAIAKASEEVGAIYTVSSLSTRTLEDITTAGPNCVKWLQLYIFKTRKLTEDYLKRAAGLDFKALVLTVDAPFKSVRRDNFRNPLTASVMHPYRVANFPSEAHKEEETMPLADELTADITWDDLPWLRSKTTLPIILKGIMTAEDAEKAVQCGIEGIWVSNHGGRELDTIPAAIDVLPEIVKQVNGRAEIYFDSGVRNGTDAIKALAYGAKAVFLGRPAWWGLAYDGKNGLKRMLDLINTELKDAMALIGARTIADLEPSMVTHESKYSRL